MLSMKIIEMSLKNVKKDETRFRENQKLAKDRQEKLLEEKMTLEHNLNMLEKRKEQTG